MNTESAESYFSLRGEVALITGGGTGIGRAIAACMHQAGATVALVGRREDVLKETCAALGERAVYFQGDITQFDATPELVSRVEGRVGPVTCLVNNAGIHLKKPAVETTPEAFRTVIDTHVIAAHALVRAIAPGMMQRKHGSILFTASMASYFGIPQVVAYSAAKSAYFGMVRTLATELSPSGVRVNAISPGWIETEMSRKALEGDPARLAKILSRTPAGRLGKPDEVGWTAVFLASRAAGFITGAEIPVDGGANIGF